MQKYRRNGERTPQRDPDQKRSYCASGGLVNWEILPRSLTIKSEVYCHQLDWVQAVLNNHGINLML